MVKNLKKPIPKDVAKLIKDSFFCPRDNKEQDIEICCPFEGIDPPLELKPANLPDKNACLTQTGVPASCALYSNCSPFLELLLNLQKPIPSTLPRLMVGSWLCGRQNIGGFNLPKICCPDQAIVKPTTTTTTTTTTSTTTTTTTTTPKPLDPSEPLQFALHRNRKLLSSVGSCGFRSVQGRIVNGEEAGLGEFPWLANLGTRPMSSLWFTFLKMAAVC